MKVQSSSPVTIDLAGLIALRHRLVGTERPAPQRFSAGQGPYRTRLRGRGMEFAEVRAYEAGDDARTIDWRVTARRGKVHTKLFHEEREQPVLIVVDYRRPMFFATRGAFKAVQASQLAALYAWQALAKGDRVGGVLFSEEEHREVRPRSGKGGVLQLLRLMVENPAWNRPPQLPFTPRQRLALTLQRLHRVARPGTRILLLSDFAQWDDEVEKELLLLGRHCEVTLVHCYDPLEAELPPAGSYRVSDGAFDLTIVSDQLAARRRYADDFATFRQRVSDFALQHRCHYLPLCTIDDPLAPLQPGKRGVR